MKSYTNTIEAAIGRHCIVKSGDPPVYLTLEGIVARRGTDEIAITPLNGGVYPSDGRVVITSIREITIVR
jgi:hypothetical protein